MAREYAAVTTRGLRRTQNEDAMAVCGALLTGERTEPVHGSFGAAEAALFAVADGIGGHVHGALASREAVTELMASAALLHDAQGCTEAVRRANLRLQDLMFRRAETVGMGTTLAGLSLGGGSARWFNVGDSRIYRLCAGALEQLSLDDTEAASEPGAPRSSHALLHSLGGQRMLRPVQPHVGRIGCVAGERWLLCSDGLTDMLRDREIGAVLAARPGAKEAVSALLAAALHAGGRDNISLVVVQ